MKTQIGIKQNEEEAKKLEQLKELLNIKGCFGEDSQTYKKAVELAIEYLNKVKPQFQLYEQLFVEERKRLFKGTPADKVNEIRDNLGDFDS